MLDYVKAIIKDHFDYPIQSNLNLKTLTVGINEIYTLSLKFYPNSKSIKILAIKDYEWVIFYNKKEELEYLLPLYIKRIAAITEVCDKSQYIIRSGLVKNWGNNVNVGYCHFSIKGNSITLYPDGYSINKGEITSYPNTNEELLGRFLKYKE